MEEKWFRFDYDDEQVLFMDDNINVVHYPGNKLIIDTMIRAIYFFRNNGIDTNVIGEYRKMMGLEAI